nr:GABA transporter 1-like isoform X4 [Malus domestica]
MTMKREVADHQRDRVDCMHCAGSALYTHTMCTHTPHISAFDSAPIPLLSLLLVFVEREREMGTLPPRSVAVDDARVEDAKVGQEEADRDRQQKQLDAGALFVLKSKGSWVHCGYHLTTSIVAPPLLSLPYAFTFLGCMAGILCLVIEALVTFYSYNLISLVFENYAQLGRRHLRLRDMALDILGHVKERRSII